MINKLHARDDAEALIPPPTTSTRVMEEYYEKQLRALTLEAVRRECEALRIYEPMSGQKEFHECRAAERILYGSNRSGKTLTAAVEFARAVTGQDPHGKYPKQDGLAILCALSGTQIAEVFYKYLFRAGAFKMIKDTTTGKWRAFRQWDPKDVARKDEVKPSCPLIPGRFIKDIAWEDKKRNIPSKVTLKNGWELLFFSSHGKPPRGNQADIAWFDEEIDDGEWYPEMCARLMDRSGRFWWSATPQNGTEALYALSQRAEEEIGNPEPTVVAFNLLLFQNLNIDPKEAKKLAAKYANMPDEYKVRIEGKFNVGSYLMYPEFNMAEELHGQEPFLVDETFNLHMVVDPGRQVCAVLFFAVPCPNWHAPEQIYLYDELYLRHCTADIFGLRVKDRVGGRLFTSFIVDPSAPKQDLIGGGPSLMAQYSEALRKNRVESRNTGYSFEIGCNDLTSGCSRVASFMTVSAEYSRPRLKVFRGRCPNFEWEMKYYRRKKINGEWSDLPVQKNDHAMDASRYFIMRDPKWEPMPVHQVESAHFQIYKALKAQRDKERGRQGIYFGAGQGHN